MEFTPPDAPVEDLAEFALWARTRLPASLAAVIPELATCSPKRASQIADMFGEEGWPWTAFRIRKIWIPT